MWSDRFDAVIQNNDRTMHSNWDSIDFSSLWRLRFPPIGIVIAKSRITFLCVNVELIWKREADMSNWLRWLYANLDWQGDSVRYIFHSSNWSVVVSYIISYNVRAPAELICSEHKAKYTLIFIHQIIRDYTQTHMHKFIYDNYILIMFSSLYSCKGSCCAHKNRTRGSNFLSISFSMRAENSDISMAMAWHEQINPSSCDWIQFSCHLVSSHFFIDIACSMNDRQ